MASLDGNRIVVLGGSSGIGLAVAQAAAREGAQPVIASSRRARIDEALATLPKGAEGHVLDMRDAGAFEAFFARTGAFDHLVYTAGDALTTGKLADLPIADARKGFEVRFWGSYAAAKYGHPHIRPGGSIVFTSGVSGRRPNPGRAIGSSLCAAAEGLTRALAVELAPIRVNLVCPGAVETPLWDSLPADTRAQVMTRYAKALPVGHVATADEVADAYLYLMKQTFSTGEIVVVDGGGVLV